MDILVRLLLMVAVIAMLAAIRWVNTKMFRVMTIVRPERARAVRIESRICDVLAVVFGVALLLALAAGPK